METHEEGKTMNQVIQWSARILAILFILFLMMFSLDVFEEGLAWTQIVLGLLIHNLPAFILIGIVLISWKHPLVGAVAFPFAGAAYALMILINGSGFASSAILLLSLPTFIIGILYGVGAYLSKKDGKK